MASNSVQSNSTPHRFLSTWYVRKSSTSPLKGKRFFCVVQKRPGSRWVPALSFFGFGGVTSPLCQVVIDPGTESIWSKPFSNAMNILKRPNKKKKGLYWFNCRHTKHNKTYNFLLVQSLAIEIQAAQLRCAFCRCWWAIQPASSRLKFVNIAWEVGRIAEVGQLYGCMRPPHFWLPQHISVDTCSWMTCGRIHRGEGLTPCPGIPGFLSFQLPQWRAATSGGHFWTTWATDPRNTR